EAARIERFAMGDEEDLRELVADEALCQEVYERKCTCAIEATERLVEKEPGRPHIILARQRGQRKGQTQGQRDLIAGATGEDSFALEFTGAAVVDGESIALAIPLYVMVASLGQEGRPIAFHLFFPRFQRCRTGILFMFKGGLALYESADGGNITL